MEFIIAYLTSGLAVLLYILIFRYKKVKEYIKQYSEEISKELDNNKDFQEMNNEMFYEDGYEVNSRVFAYILIRITLLSLIFLYPFVIIKALIEKYK